MTNRIDSTNCTHDAALARIKELEDKLDAANEQARLREIDCANLETERNDLSSRLSSALKFVDYIAKRYEEGWDEPITERFYNEAKALLVEKL